VSEPLWLSVEDVISLHGEQLALFGGPGGIRDRGLLESAVARPLNQWSYGVDQLPALAAAYAFGLSRNRPFLDGNKRAAFAAMIVFLRYNGVPFRPMPNVATAAMMSLAAGELSEDELAEWIAHHWPDGVAKTVAD
jgi:death-on-curing protein